METIIIQRTTTNGIDQASATRDHVEDKPLINCRTVDVNQLMPLKYQWAWEHHVNGCANHWMPSEVPMGKDIETRRVGDRVREAVDLEMAYMAGRRLERIGLPARYGSGNPFPWMSEIIDLGEEKNFFETRVTEYQSAGALSWD